MLSRVLQFFAPPIFEDPEKTRIARILNLSAWITIFVIFSLIILRLFTNEFQTDPARYILILVIVVGLLTQVLLRKGYVYFAGGFAIVFCWLATTYQAYQGNGLRDIALLAHISIIIIAALVLGWKQGVMVGALSLSAIWFFAFQENTHTRIAHVAPPFFYARDLSSIFIVTSILVYYLIYYLNLSLSAVQVELQERLKVEEKLQLQAQYLTALHETTLGLLNRLELNPLLESIISRASDLLNTSHVALDLVTPDGSALQQEIGLGKFSPFNGKILKENQGIANEVWKNGKTIVIKNYEAWDNKLSYLADVGFKTVMCAPLKSGDKVIGVLAGAYTQEKEFTQDQSILLERFATLVSVAIDNARLYQAAQTEILERKIIEAELRSSDERFRKVFNNNKVAISIVTLEEGTFLEANEAFWQLTGLSPEKTLGRSSLDLNLWEQKEERELFVKELLEKGSLANLEVDFDSETPAIKNTLAYYELINIKDQLCIACLFFDVSELRRTEQALKDSEARMRAILEAIPDVIFEISTTGILLDYIASSDVEPFISPTNFIGKNIKHLFPEDVVGQTLQSIQRAIEAQQLHAFEYALNNDRETRFFEARVSAVTENTAIVMIRNISQRKWVESERENLIAELERRNAEAETLRESVAIVVKTLNKTEAIEQILEQLEKVIPFDTASVQLFNEGMFEIVSTRGLEPKDEYIGMKFGIDKKEAAYPLISKQAPYVLVEDIQLTSPAFHDKVHNKIHAWMGIPLKVQGKLIGIIALDGHTVGQFTKKDAELALTYANQVAIAIENARLFSELQNELLERKKLIEELEGKNAELERFTYTVSHDLKSPLITIKGFLGFLERDSLSGNQTRLRSDIQRISEATNKMQTLLSELLNLSRIGRMMEPPQLVPFNNIVSEALEIVQGRLLKQEIQVHVHQNMPTVYVDQKRIVEVVQNLIDNAAKFVSQQPLPEIEIGQAGYENNMPIFFIRDNGIGIDPAHHERIFGLFNKLEADSEGTGIGLALVKRIIEVHQGRVWVQSQPQKGATFYFTLPTQPAT
jgi:PAS domain S-box-containing protein